jgi:hypothetical protein
MQIEDSNGLLEDGISRCDPALRGSGACSQATAATAGCLRREAGSERDGVCFLEPVASGFKPMTGLADRPGKNSWGLRVWDRYRQSALPPLTELQDRAKCARR